MLIILALLGGLVFGNAMYERNYLLMTVGFFIFLLSFLLP